MNDQVVNLSWIYAVAKMMGLSHTQAIATLDQTAQNSAHANLWRQPQSQAKHLLAPENGLSSTLDLSLSPFLYALFNGGFGRRLISLFTRTNTSFGSVVHADGVS